MVTCAYGDEMTRKKGKSTKQKGVSSSPKGAAVAAERVAGRGSRATVDRILASAHHVLVTRGYAEFTTRRVADAARISPGNLSYHFPTKRGLLRALVSQLVDHYATNFEVLLADTGIPPGKALERLVQWLLVDSLAEENVRIFRELWAISLHDTLVRKAIDDLYDELMDRVFQRIRSSCPGADETSIRELLQVLALISEGSIVLYGTRRKRVVPYERVISLAISVLGTIAPDLGTSADVAKKR